MDAGFIFVFSVGWRKGFFYDLTPLQGDIPQLREYDLEELLGSLYSYLLFQERFKISEGTWGILFKQKWFPFAHLDDEILKKIINHAKEHWNIDEILPEVEANVKRLLDEFNPFDKSISYFFDHIELLEQAIDRYRNGDYISCASILYPRIEGLMRSFYKVKGYKQKPTAKALTKAVINHKKSVRLSKSLLLPEKFHQYLDNIYFANFDPGTSPDVGRHSIAHGEARADDFSLKSSTLGFLILYQLSLFF